MGTIPGLAQWVKDPELLQAAVEVPDAALICLLAREPPYAADVAMGSGQGGGDP